MLTRPVFQSRAACALEDPYIAEASSGGAAPLTRTETSNLRVLRWRSTFNPLWTENFETSDTDEKTS